MKKNKTQDRPENARTAILRRVILDIGACLVELEALRDAGGRWRIAELLDAWKSEVRQLGSE